MSAGDAGRKPLQRVGFWFGRSEQPRGVDPARVVDPGWARNERDLFVRYLRSGFTWASYPGYSFCRFTCGIANEDMGTSDLTDGTWLWPEGLWHYVVAHDICLPDAFLAHARTNNFVMPREVFGVAPDRDDVLCRRATAPVADTLWLEWADGKNACRQ